MNLLVDTDAFCKLGVAALLEDAAGVFGARLTECGRLAALPYMLRKGNLVRRYGRDTCNALLSHAEAMPIHPTPGATALEPLTQKETIDPGEAQLFAAAAEFGFMIITGDKRAVRALKHVTEIHAQLAGRIVTLEAVLLKLCEKLGLEDLRQRIRPLTSHDKAVRISFSTESSDPAMVCDPTTTVLPPKSTLCYCGILPRRAVREIRIQPLRSDPESQARRKGGAGTASADSTIPDHPVVGDR